jgi:hypothetical protein
MYKIKGADQKEYGPINADQVRQWIAEGRLNAQTNVLAEGATEWRPISELPEFAASFPTLPPPGMAAAAPMVSSAAQDMVNGPATALIVLAILGFVMQVAGLVMNLLGTSFMPKGQMEQPAWANIMSGAGAIVGAVIGIVMSGLVLFGGLKMKKLESYGLVMTCSIISMIPCVSPCCVIGLPIGIWAVVVLSKPEVKGAFH